MSEAIQRADEPVRKGGIGAGRIAFLDGFRGVAILPVIGFHYFTRYATDPRHIVPYGDALAGTPLNAYGFYGVMLFFAVSGFVIAMTLDHTHNFLEFAVRRFARLWPTMLVCSIITFLVLLTWPVFGPRRLVDFLPSLTFMDGHTVWGRISPSLESHWMDRAYWTLFVEVRFYFWAGIIYFLSKKHFVVNMSLFMLIAACAYAFSRHLGMNHVSGNVTFLFLAPFLPWFVLGLGAYKAWGGAHRVGLGMLVGSVATLGVLELVHAPDANLCVALMVGAMFIMGLYCPFARRVFGMRWLSVIGVSSYSLYLLHQDIGVTLIHVISKALGLSGIPSIAVALAVVLVMVALAYAIYVVWEHPVNRWMVRRYKQWASKVGLLPARKGEVS